MQLHREDIIALGDTIVRAVRDCQAILVAAAERPPEVGQAVAPEAAAGHTQAPELLTRTGASDYLTNVVGYPVSRSTLAKLAVSGAGPTFQSFGRRVLYAPADLMDWAKRRSRKGRNTSDQGSPV